MDDTERGLYSKYSHIERADGSSRPGQKHHNCQYFVLDLDHDPHAIPALRAYAVSCAASHPKLADDLWKLCQRLSKEPTDG